MNYNERLMPCPFCGGKANMITIANGSAHHDVSFTFEIECFIQKHRIFTEDNEEKTGKNRKMTREELIRMGAVMGVMQDKSWTQRIEG